VRVLAEIPARSAPELRAGSLRRGDLEAFGGLLERLGGARTVLAVGSTRRTVALGLATTAVARGLRTVLVECDLANPCLADSLGLANAPGLSEYLRGAADATAILKPVVLAGPGSNEATEPLVCVVAGRPVDDASELLASNRLARAISGLKESYDLVVLDSPSDSLLADSTIACVGPAESWPDRFVSGLVIQN
jgi:MinD-like ATPase involved in chromosome partitioning or flagellar assembly